MTMALNLIDKQFKQLNIENRLKNLEKNNM